MQFIIMTKWSPIFSNLVESSSHNSIFLKYSSFEDLFWIQTYVFYFLLLNHLVKYIYHHYDKINVDLQDLLIKYLHDELLFVLISD